MPCDGGVGECIGCGDVACLRESGYCSEYCEEGGLSGADSRVVVSGDNQAALAVGPTVTACGPGVRPGASLAVGEEAGTTRRGGGQCSDYCEEPPCRGSEGLGIWLHTGAPEFEELREAVEVNQRALDRLAES